MSFQSSCILLLLLLPTSEYYCVCVRACLCWQQHQHSIPSLLRGTFFFLAVFSASKKKKKGTALCFLPFLLLYATFGSPEKSKKKKRSNKRREYLLSASGDESASTKLCNIEWTALYSPLSILHLFFFFLPARAPLLTHFCAVIFLCILFFFFLIIRVLYLEGVFKHLCCFVLFFFVVVLFVLLHPLFVFSLGFTYTEEETGLGFSLLRCARRVLTGVSLKRPFFPISGHIRCFFFFSCSIFSVCLFSLFCYYTFALRIIPHVFDHLTFLFICLCACVSLDALVL